MAELEEVRADVAWRRVATESSGLALYRVDTSPQGIASPGRDFDPLDLLLGQFDTTTAVQIRREFCERGAAVGASSLRVAAHVVSTPDAVLVVDSTFRTTAGRVFPGVLHAIDEAEGRTRGQRPITVVYTHAHFDHAGGRAAVEALDGATTVGHAFTRALFPLVSRPETMFRSKGRFLRDCDIRTSFDEMMAAYSNVREKALAGVPASLDLSLFRTPEEPDIRLDVEVDPADESVSLLDGAVELYRFEGHIPGHLCVLVAGRHLITGDMWLPATTSTVTPRGLAMQANVAGERCGVLLYVDSCNRLLDLPVDTCRSYPSHEHIFDNPKRMALRDLDSFARRMELVRDVLAEHRRAPMRVLDLTWGGLERRPIWKLAGSKYRLLLAHDEAAAYVEDLLAAGDLEEVDEERYVWTGRTSMETRIRAARDAALRRFNDLEYRSRAV